MIRAVMFDAGGVLHVANTAVGDDLQQELGLSSEQVNKILARYVPLLGTGKITERAVWDELRQTYGIRAVSENERLFSRAFARSLQKMPGMYALIDELKAKGVTVLLLSNVTPQFAAVLKEAGHYDPFDFKVLSYEVGAWKPDPVIFQHALQKSGVQPNEVVFIDDQEKNVVAARELGMHGIVFQDAAQTARELAKLWP